MLENLRKKLMGNKELYPNLEQESLNGRYGPIPGIDVFTTWKTRDEMRKAGMHTPRIAGIAGSIHEGAYSIVMNGGYVDDADEGNFISYTGAGPTTGRDDTYGGTSDDSHRGNQSFKHPHNRALQKSAETGRPVRVIRGPNLGTKYAPRTGYRYDGLYKVIRTHETKGKGGYMVCKFDMNAHVLGSISASAGSAAAAR